MNMNLSELLKKGRIEKTPADQTQIGNLLKISKRDILVAEHLLSVNSDASFMHSYNSVLQSARALMFSKGYRPTENEHKTAIEFVSEIRRIFSVILEKPRLIGYFCGYDFPPEALMKL